MPPGPQPFDDLTRLHAETGGGRSSFGGVGAGPLSTGQAFGSRYHIIRLLGAGGMGAVYQAWDEDLGVAVAIKVIRPEVASDPSQAADLERRFKRELLLARQVTHKNVVRIHDLGEIDGIKYITMPYIKGQDLANVLKTVGKLPVAAALRLAKQIATGLQAAHEAGVVHRDLKPANIMVEEEQATIMDFGIARSTSGGGTVMAVVGTLEYMAPEQARAGLVDHRADLYAFGLILYDMLLGRRHAARPESAVAELMERIQHAPPSPRTIDPLVPQAVDAIVNRCLQPDAAARYQTTAELVADLEALDADGHPLAGRTVSGVVPVAVGPVGAVGQVGPGARGSRSMWKWVAAASVLSVGVAGFTLRDRLRSAAPVAAVQASPVSLAILPFRNASGDASLDWLGAGFADMVRAELAGSSSLRTVPAGRVHTLLSDLRVPNDATLDSAMLQRVGDYASAETVIWGQFVRFGAQIRFDATLHDFKRQRATPLTASAASVDGVLVAVAEVARAIRADLTPSPSAAQRLDAGASRPSSRSVDALRYYNEGLAMARQGKHSEAVKRFEAATEEDASFALAFGQLARAQATLGSLNEAEQHARKAVDLSAALPPTEKYIVLAIDARVRHDNKTAIESYENLLKLSPQEAEVQSELAALYEDTGRFDRARELYAGIVASDPKDLTGLVSLGRIEIKRRNAQAALDPLNRALSLAVQLENDEAKADILAALGSAYRGLDKPADALRHLEEALSIKQRIGQKGGIAQATAQIAQVQWRLGKPDAALAGYQQARELQRQIGDRKGLGGTLIGLGGFYLERRQLDEALSTFREALQIQREMGDVDGEAFCLTSVGNVYLIKAQYEDALTYFERALQLREKTGVPGEVALSVHHLADTSSKLGQYNEAIAYYLRALDLWRTAGNARNAAMADHGMAIIFEYQGRYAAAVSAREEGLKALREVQDRSFYTVDVLSGYGHALAQLGQFDEARKHLDEAMQLARDRKSQTLVAKVLNFQGATALYRGDRDQARRLFEQALELSSAAKDRPLTLLSRANLAKADVASGRSQGAIKPLKELTADAEALGLKYLSVESSVSLAEAYLNTRALPLALDELGRAVANSERLGLRLLVAKSHHLLARALDASNRKAEARRHRAEAARALGEIQQEAKSDDILKRADLAAISADARSASQTS